MKAAVMKKAGFLHVTDLPDPKPKDKEVLIKVHGCGTAEVTY